VEAEEEVCGDDVEEEEVDGDAKVEMR